MLILLNNDADADTDDDDDDDFAVLAHYKQMLLMRVCKLAFFPSFDFIVCVASIGWSLIEEVS